MRFFGRGWRRTGRDDAEDRVAAVVAGFPQLGSGRAQVRVDGGGDAPLRGLVREDVGGDQPLQEPAEPGVARVERAELLE